MHRLWNILEIIEEILDWVGKTSEYPDRAERTYAALSRTARLFSLPATRHLWADITGTALLSLLNALKAARGLPKTAAKRFEHYAFIECHIKALTIDSYDEVSLKLANAYLDMTRMRARRTYPMFPKLIKLTFQASGEPSDFDIFPLYASASYYVVKCLLTLNIQKICYKPDVSHLNMFMKLAASFLENIPSSCAALTELEVSIQLEFPEGVYLLDPDMLDNVVAKAVAQLPKLHTFTGPAWGFCPSMLRSLSRHKTLFALSISESCEDDYMAYVDYRPVSTLKASHSTSIGWFVPLREFRFWGNTTLLKALLPGPGSRTDTTGRVMEQMPLLRSLAIDAFTLGDSSFSFTSFIERLRTCPHVVHFDLEVNFPAVEPLSDQHIEMLALTWPKLEYLHIITGWERKTCLTLRSLWHLSSHCHALNDVQLELTHLEIAGPVSAIVPVRNPIEIHLSVPTSLSDDSDKDARTYLRGLWPAGLVQLQSVSSRGHS
ncbi:hypothetical protein CALVIDRAFT_524719 [Calocera viscosa TUFC12733]|uniref:F-box domain-containing protein n=1 Tax=Calocera viscosa (strain TUFC12733) TaxID=1330018 RepID=A0A167QXV0_CALVF|nr:hypothetical protein CALVIDRAFT_524719 [Calocera viscosa TUFC12733]